jgi:hypothetical protein
MHTNNPYWKNKVEIKKEETKMNRKKLLCSAIIMGLGLFLIMAGPQSLTSKVQADPLAPRVTYKLKDAKNQTYKIYVVGENEQTELASYEPKHDWASVVMGINEGDTLYHGDYKVFLQKEGSDEITDTGIEKKDYTYNATGKTIYAIPSHHAWQPGLLFIAEYISSSSEAADIYMIQENKLVPVTVGMEQQLEYTKRPRITGKNLYQTATWSNAEAEWEFVTYELKLDGPYLKEVKKEILSADKGQKIVDKWKKDWT